MIFFPHCDNCIHIWDKQIDGWNVACDAFPEGIPNKFIMEIDVRTLTECKNGIRFEPKEDTG